jgi:hypothetical protein
MSAATHSAGAAIRPFAVPVASGEELQELRSRVAATRWPDAETVKDHSQGVQLDTVQELASYWASDYNWRACEAKLNHDAYSYGEIAKAFSGKPVGELTRDEILDNITLYWMTNTGISSGRLYWDNNFGFFAAWEQPQIFSDEVRASFRSLR